MEDVKVPLSGLGHGSDDVEGLAIQGLPLTETVGASVDNQGDLLDGGSGVAEEDEFAYFLPPPGCRGDWVRFGDVRAAKFKHLGVVDRLGEEGIVVAAGQLEVAGPFELHAVSWEDVSEVRTPLVGRSRGQFLHPAAAATLVSGLGQKVTHVGLGCDAEPGNPGVELRDFLFFDLFWPAAPHMSQGCLRNQQWGVRFFCIGDHSSLDQLVGGVEAWSDGGTGPPGQEVLPAVADRLAPGADLVVPTVDVVQFPVGIVEDAVGFGGSNQEDPVATPTRGCGGSVVQEAYTYRTQLQGP